MFTTEIAARCCRNSSQWQHSSSPVYSGADSSDRISDAILEKKRIIPASLIHQSVKRSHRKISRLDEVEPEAAGAFSADIGESSSIVQETIIRRKTWNTTNTETKVSVIWFTESNRAATKMIKNTQAWTQGQGAVSHFSNLHVSPTWQGKMAMNR